MKERLPIGRENWFAFPPVQSLGMLLKNFFTIRRPSSM